MERLQLNAAPLQDRLIGNVRQRLWLVMGAVSFVLLVACTNVASLLLARASTRQRELALRMALGARRGRVARLVLTESLLLALLASGVALLFAYLTGGVARTLLADRIPHVGSITIDARVLGFTVAVAAVTGMVCALVSLPGVRRLTGSAVLASGAPAVTGRNRIRRLLLSAETAVTFVLVIGAALFVQTLWNLSAQDRGFDADRLLAVRVTPGVPPDVDRRERARSKFFTLFFTDLRDRLERMPGVVSAGAVSLGPLEGFSSGFGNIAVNGKTASSRVFHPGRVRHARLLSDDAHPARRRARLHRGRSTRRRPRCHRQRDLPAAFRAERRHPWRTRHFGIGSGGLYDRRRDARRSGSLASPGARASPHRAAGADARRSPLMGRADIRPAQPPRATRFASRQTCGERSGKSIPTS